VEMLSASFVIPTGVFVHCLPLLVFSIFQRERERTDWARCPAACESANWKPLPFIASAGTLQRGPWRERERAAERGRLSFLQGVCSCSLPRPLSLHCCLIIKWEANFVYRRWFVLFLVCTAPGACAAGRQVVSMHGVPAASRQSNTWYFQGV